jgi:hypothetical protein
MVVAMAPLLAPVPVEVELGRMPVHGLKAPKVWRRRIGVRAA